MSNTFPLASLYHFQTQTIAQIFILYLPTFLPIKFSFKISKSVKCSLWCNMFEKRLINMKTTFYFLTRIYFNFSPLISAKWFFIWRYKTASCSYECHILHGVDLTKCVYELFSIVISNECRLFTSKYSKPFSHFKTWSHSLSGVNFIHKQLW